MSSVGQAILGVFGAVVGFFAGGPVGAYYGFAIGSLLGNIVDPASGPNQSRTGPRLNDLKVGGSEVGIGIPLLYGNFRVAGNVIWGQPIKEVVTTETSGGGGKGGGGGGTTTTTTYSYFGTFAMLLCAGPTEGIRRIWANGKMVYEKIDAGTDEADEASEEFETYFKFYKGDETQTADPTIQSFEGAANVPAHRGTSYVVFTDLPLADYGNQIPQLTFEVAGLSKRRQGILYKAMANPPVGPSAIGAEISKFAVDYVNNYFFAMTGGTGNGNPDQAYLYRANLRSLQEDRRLMRAGVSFQGAQAGGFFHSPYCGPDGFLYLNRKNVTVGTGNRGMILSKIDPESLKEVANFGIGGEGGQDQNTTTQFISAQYMCMVGSYIVVAGVLRNVGVLQSLGTSIVYVWGANQRVDENSIAGIAAPGPLATGNVNASPVYIIGGGLPLGSHAGREAGAGFNDGSGTGDLSIGIYQLTVGGSPVMTKIATLTSASIGRAAGLQMTCRPMGVDPTDGGVLLLLYPYDPSLPSANGVGFGVLTFGGHFIKYVPGTGITLNLDVGGIQTGNTPNRFCNDTTAGTTSDRFSNRKVIWVSRAALNNTGIRLHKVDLKTGTYETSVLPRLTSSTVFTDVLYGGHIYDGRAGALYTTNVNDGGGSAPYCRVFPEPYLSDAPVAVSEVVADIAVRAGLTAAQVDVTQIAEEIEGYAVGRPTPARAAIQPLCAFGISDPVERNGVLKFVRRGAVPALTLTTEDIGAVTEKASEDSPPPIAIERTQDVELPRKVRVHYASKTREFQNGEQSASRLVTAAVNVVDVDMPLALEDAEAFKFAEKLLFDMWVSRNRYTFSVGTRFMRLEPSDVVLLPVDGETQRVRIIGIDYTIPGILKCVALRDDDGILTSRGEGAAGAYTPPALAPLAQTTLLLADLPLLTQADDNAGYWAALYGDMDWRGAVVDRSTNAGMTYQRAGSKGPPASVVGTVGGVLGSGPVTISDNGNTLTVTLQAGELESTTLDGLYAGANAAAIGAYGRWEIVQFLNATLNMDGTYTLSGLLRGRRGTEWAVGTHMAGDKLILLRSDILLRLALETSLIGQTLLHEASGIGANVPPYAAVSHVPTGTALKPFAPTYLRGARDGGGDLTITWLRRGRIGEELRSNVDIPLSEDSERYEIEVLNGPTVVRTLTATTGSVIYTAAQQTTDFGSAQAGVTVRIYQLSAQVGRGYPLGGTV